MCAGGIYPPLASHWKNFAEYAPEELKGLEGLHFHCLCEQNADALVTTMNAVEEKFGAYLYQMKWLNMAAGIISQRDDYDVETLAATLERARRRSMD